MQFNYYAKLGASVRSLLGGQRELKEGNAVWAGR